MLAAAQCPEVLFLYLVNCCVINSGKILASHAKVFCRLCERQTMEQVDVNDLSLQISQSREQRATKSDSQTVQYGFHLSYHPSENFLFDFIAVQEKTVNFGI